MTATRPWASAACLAGRPDDCPRVKDDGRRCANPAHDAYPDDLQPAGVQPTLPDAVADAIQATAEAPSAMGRLLEAADGYAERHPEQAPTMLADVILRPTCGPGCDGRSHGLDCNARTIDGTPPTVVTPPRRRRWTCDRCGELVIRAEHVTGTRKDPAYACEVERVRRDMEDPAYCTPGDLSPEVVAAASVGDLNVDPNATADETDPGHGDDEIGLAEWDDDGDPHDVLAAAANTVRDFPDIGHVLPYGNNPDSVDLADQVNAAIRAKAYPEPDPFAPTPVQDGLRRLARHADVKLALEVLRAAGWVCWVPVEPALTAGEVKRVTAAHMVLRPEQALDVARTIIAERLTNPEGIDQ